jgi:hypothetical protein
MKLLLTRLLLIAAIPLLNSCGGGGGTVAEGGIGGTGISVGRITEFGSIFVNGIEYETDSTTFNIDNASGSESDLAIGMVVRVSGSKDVSTASGTAVSVDYNSLVTGPVDVVFSTTADELGVMGQTVSVNSDTVFEGSALKPTLSDLAIDDIVEVSGFSDGDSGRVLATRIELKSAVTQFEVIGSVVPIAATTTFQIGGLTIEAGALTIPPAGTLVEVEGNAALVGGELVADEISTVGNGDGTVGDDGEEIEIEGQVTDDFDAGTNRFSLNGQVVEIIAGADIEGGTTADIITDRIVEVEGVIDGDILLAEEIELEVEDEDKTELLTQIGSGDVDVAAKTVILMGKVIQVDNSTIFESERDTESTFILADLMPGDFLEAKVFDDGGVLTASKLTLENAPSPHDSELEGRPSDLPDPNQIEILGITIDHTGVTLPYATLPDRIEVKGTYNGTLLDADSIDLAD